MKNFKHLLGISSLVVAGIILLSADHIDAPAVQGSTSDITDFYAFEGKDNHNMVFVANVQGLLSPSATADAAFDENVMIEFNIDNNGDNIEDLVIQVIQRNKKMYFVGPIVPNQTGLVSTLSPNFSKDGTSVKITPYGEEPIIGKSQNGISVFAGPRDDPFFFDFAQFGKILNPNDPATSFNNPGTDTFAGTNVLSVVIEVPKELLGNSDSINTWVETKLKQ
ncbi:MAG: DUF4331 domain-containing protein [Bacteroidia bacterium]|nr:DUF4331 domain-containing protein [Bacteroidia bacterium]NND24698.1 DUF4331 family protein [Flavobacteriaceae bacterium]MBT8278796.1 DUF4331 domain-containing protein [Bacteroidia bacterium]NNK59040.1 DUF4331 family protein [Flavobacteriaceae bacterium]NNL33762.1 DUF4331 family protein [Flavobacteriaceae bacterium]